MVDEVEILPLDLGDETEDGAEILEEGSEIGNLLTVSQGYPVTREIKTSRGLYKQDIRTIWVAV